MYNKHLNIFHYYNGSITSEDNLSRILARILMERNYQKFQKKILSFLSVSGDIDFVFSHISVSNMKKYLNENGKQIQKYIPVTLTSRGEKFIRGYSKTDRSIPDIVLLSNDTLIFLEVKLGQDIPQEQVLNQVRSYLEVDDYQAEVFHLYWEDLITLLSQLYPDDFFIKDYLEIIDSKYTHWFQYSLRDTLERVHYQYRLDHDFYCKNNLVNIWIYRMIEKYMKGHKIKAHEDFLVRRAFPLENFFSTEMQYRLNLKDHSLDAHIWTGETIEYTKEFHSYYQNHTELVQSFISSQNHPYQASYYMVPYILFRDHFGYLKTISLHSLKNKILPEDLVSLLSRRLKYQDYAQLICDHEGEIKRVIPKFQTYFDDTIKEFYKNTGRTNITVSIGYDIVVSYPLDEIIQLDENRKLNDLIDDTIHVYEKYFEMKVGKK